MDSQLPSARPANDTSPPLPYPQVHQPWFFGQWLASRGVIDLADLQRAVAMAMGNRQRLGTLAVARGMLTQEQAKHVHEAQRTHDRYFGEMAQDLGLMTLEEVTTLLQLQRDSHMKLGQALVRLGILGHATVTRYLEDYIAEQASSASDSLFSAPLRPHPLAAVLMTRLADMILRLTAVPAKLAPAEEWDGGLNQHTAYITLNGEYGACLALSCDDDQALSLTRGLLELPADGLIESGVVHEALGEVLTVLASSVTASLATEGILVQHAQSGRGCPFSQGHAFFLATPEGHGLALLDA